MDRAHSRLIGAAVDLDRKANRYVWNVRGGGVTTRYGFVPIPYGRLSDGATGVPDGAAVTFFAHDELYLHPEVWVKHGKRRLNRFQCDLAYAELLFKMWHPVWAIFRPLGLILINSFPRSPWRKARAREDAWEKSHGHWTWRNQILKERRVPSAECWRFPTHKTAKAVWVGPLSPLSPTQWAVEDSAHS